MSVLKNKRKPSQFEVFHHLNKLRKEITELLLRDFGYSFEKSEKRLQARMGGRSFDDLNEYEDWFRSWFKNYYKYMSKQQRLNITNLFERLKEEKLCMQSL